MYRRRFRTIEEALFALGCFAALMLIVLIVILLKG